LVVINKVDRKDARPLEVVNEVGDLFLELVSELDLDPVADFGGIDVFDFPVLFASGREGWAKRSLDDSGNDVVPLLDAILEHVPEPRYDVEGPLQLQITTLDYSDYLGRIGIGRVTQGILRSGDRVLVAGREGDRVESVRELFTFDKL